MRKLNIAMVCDSVTHLLAGTTFSAIRFAMLLKQRGHKIIFLSAKYPETSSIDYFNGIKVYRFKSIRMAKKENQYFAFPNKRELEKILIKEKIDILHIIMPYFLAKESMKVAKKLGIKIVCHSHTQPENLFSRLPKFLQMKMFNHIFYKYLVGIYTNSEITICPSNLAVKLLKRYSPSINTTVISNGIDLDYWKKIKYIQFIKKYHLSSSDKRLLFVGRLHPEKDVATLIKTMPKIIAEYPQIHLDIVGIGYLDESLKELSKKLHVENKVTLYGRLSDKDLLMTYSACDIFVLPSLAELEGMVVLEAMTCGKPILIANAPNSASVQFVHKNGFLFKPEDKNDLSKNILKILKDEKLCKKMGEESLKIIKYYDIKNSVTLLEKTYDALMINKV